MKQLFIEKNFKPDSLALLRTINTILAEYEEAGYDLSLRQCYYQLVARGVVENTERSYKNVGNLVSDARLAGLIDWDVIKDRGRSCEERSHWSSPQELIRVYARHYHIDMWTNQDFHVEVMVEKQALEGVLLPVCEELDIPFSANKGYSSSSAMYEAGQRLRTKMDNNKKVVVFYLGDHDPSGIDMTRDVEDRLKMFSEYDESMDDVLEVRRIALNIDQVRQLNPPENPAKLTDSRAGEYIRRFGRSSWELDAIEPKKLAELVRSNVEELIDQDAWADREEERQAGKDWLNNITK